MNRRDERDAFADEQSYIAHRRHEASMARAERLRLARERLENSPRAISERKRLAQIERRILVERPYWRERSRRWRATNPERRRELNRLSYVRHREQRAVSKQRYARLHRDEIALYQALYRLEHREQRREDSRLRYQQHRDEIRARDRARYPRERDKRIAYLRAYYREHRDELRAKMRAYHHEHRDVISAQQRARQVATKPNYRGREAVLLSARTLEEQVVALRAEGWSWVEVAELTSHSKNGCRVAYGRAMHRQPLKDSDVDAPTHVR